MVDSSVLKRVGAGRLRLGHETESPSYSANPPPAEDPPSPDKPACASSPNRSDRAGAHHSKSSLFSASQFGRNLQLLVSAGPTIPQSVPLSSSNRGYPTVFSQSPAFRDFRGVRGTYFAHPFNPEERFQAPELLAPGYLSIRLESRFSVGAERQPQDVGLSGASHWNRARRFTSESQESEKDPLLDDGSAILGV